MTGFIGLQTLGQFTNSHIDQHSILKFIFRIINYIDHIWKILFILILPVPFILILNKLNFTDTVHYTLRFVLDNLVKYIIFIFCGIILIYISFLIYQIPIHFLGIISYYEPILQTITKIIRLFLEVIFYIAFFKFYIDSQPKANQNSIV